MTSFFDAFDPTVNDTSPAATAKSTDAPDGQRVRARFSGALDRARQQFGARRDPRRDRDPDRDDATAAVGLLNREAERIEVIGARDRLQRSGRSAAPGVPINTTDGPREAIPVDARSPDDAADPDDGAPREKLRRESTQPLRRAVTPARRIPVPPIPGSATIARPPRQTLSYAVRSPAMGRDEVRVTARTAAITAPRTPTTGEVAEPDAARGASRLPPAPPWAGAPDRATEAATEVEVAVIEAGPPRSKPAVAAERGSAQAIVSGPLRAYAAAMPSALPAARVADSIFGAAATAAELAAATTDAIAAAATATIGEPITANLGLDPAAMQQLSGAGVPAQSLPNPRGVGPTSPTVNLASELASGELPQVRTGAGRGGLQRAEVVVGAGDARVGLAVTTAGPHVTVEAQVPNELMADAMRNQLDDLKAALERHDLELSDLTFGEAGEQSHEGESPAANNAHEPRAADEPERAANDNALPGVRIVA